MARFLRDEVLTTLTIDEDALRQLHSAFQARVSSMPERPQENSGGEAGGSINYVIRFDNKGYRIFTIDELIDYFGQAKCVDWIIINAESRTSLQSNRLVGSYMELRLDARNPNLCLLTVSSDSGDWVDASFSSVIDVLARCKNHNGWARSAWSALAIQLGGVFFAFLYRTS